MVSIKCPGIKRLISDGFETKRWLDRVPYPQNSETISEINKFHDLANPISNNFKLPFSLLRERQGGIIYFIVWGIFLLLITILELLFFKNSEYSYMTFATPWRMIYDLFDNRGFLFFSLIGFISLSAIYVQIINRFFMIEVICILLASGKINKFRNPDEQIIRFKDPRIRDYIFGYLIMLIISFPILILRYSNF